MPVPAEYVRSLHAYELRILLALERLMRRYQWVPLEVLKSATKFSESELSYRLGRLMAMDMVRYEKTPYEGYALVFNGYDSLALHSLTRRGTVQALGTLIGVGKESEVYEAMGLGVVVLKFHRVGQRSFQSARVKRGYMPDSGHCPWIFASSNSAKMEYDALKTLHPAVSVPLPIDQNRHVVAMSFVPGVNLSRATVAEPEIILNEILDNVREAYRLGIIHGDLSEFNVMVDERQCWLIDWPQWVETAHPNAGEILNRDIENILQYFKRKYGLEYAFDEALARVVE
ncbi:serine/threonine protein phosphatase [Methanoculleus sp. YWC-01]|jgi:RIO kinase 2|uniref:non-specific serine/threonine protein kinase n=1 Tax=Methanoculleus nereidis TaxID=2735141 RepID=A0ABU3Z095_9EURY|nr:RIO1 family regulatory kinase/ATPase [Methanoculleus sp. YWC-01]MCK9298270.1 serine/threonine protein phosphatase [Methanoculleus sp.]MDV4342237.1 serine/threonine protein phosphatase [Methanoculleus sp. YWC-01]PKL57132.1 MAG: serine/threonine protein phosphatase [Methanomicrobiales archaeon HGW-Methanomicrobiales-6]